VGKGKIEETEGENEKAGNRTKNRVGMEGKVGSGKNTIEVNVEEKRMVGDDRRWIKRGGMRRREGHARTRWFSRGGVQYWCFLCV